MPKYPYTIPGEGIYKPWIEVALGYKKTHKVTPASIIALIDSGADVCFCSKTIGEWLRIQFKKKEVITFTAANGTPLHTIKEVVSLHVAGKKYECPFYFSDELPRETPIILGQAGFFDHFRIIFDVQNKEIEITNSEISLN